MANERGRPSEEDRPTDATHESPNSTLETRLHGASEPNVISQVPPDTTTQRRFAVAMCRADSYHLLKGDGSNTADNGLVSHSAAVADGRPYFGVVHPWIWAIDVDRPEHPAFAMLLSLLDGNDIEHVVVDSGSSMRTGRHVFAYVPEAEAYRKTISSAILSAHPDASTALDYRAGGTIRPPLAPHRHGGWSRPLFGDLEALEMLERWFLVETGVPVEAPEGQALPRWAVQLLNGKYNEAEQLGHKVRRNGNYIDKSAVEFSLALAFRNAGKQLNDYLAARMPGGSHPSLKALAAPARADAYLRKQWAGALLRPMPVSRIRDGLDRLDEFEQAVEAWTGFARPRATKAVLLGLIATAREIRRTTFDLDQRTLSALSGIGRSAVGWVAKRDLAPFAELLAVEEVAPGATSNVPPTSQFRLRILEMLADPKVVTSGHTVRTVGDLFVWPTIATFSIARTHPVFCNAGLGATAFETLKCFSSTEARTQSRAMSLRVDVCERTFREKCHRLQQLGVLVPSDDKPKAFLLATDVDWEDVAQHLEVMGVLSRREQRYDEDRKRQAHNQLDSGEITAKQALEVFADVGQREAQRTAEQLFKTVDQTTGLITHQSRRDLLSTHLATKVRPALVRCVCCGRPTERIEPSCGLPWHDGCRLQPWILRTLDVDPLDVPIALLDLPPAVVDPYDLDERRPTRADELTEVTAMR